MKGGGRLHPKSRSGSTSLAGVAREIAAWLGYVDPKHEDGELIQQNTKGALRATEAWIDGRHAVSDTDHSAEGHSSGAKSWVRGWQSLVDSYPPKSSNDPAMAI